MKEQTIEHVLAHKIITIVRGVDRENIFKTAEAFILGGIACMEITYDAARPETHAETAETIRQLNERFLKDLMIGAGTVLTPEQVVMTKEAGGCYIISPNVNKDVIQKTAQCGLVSMPGAFTPTECEEAHRWGADFVKLFPVGGMGPGYVKDLAAPLSHIRFLAVGGVTAENLPAFLKAGAVGAGVGSDLVNKELILSGEFSKIAQRAKQYVQAASQEC